MAAAGNRTKIPTEERLKVWVRAGGRCVICNRYLLEGELSYREVTFGELAHIIGQQESAKSPRGLAKLGRVDRDKADNILLMCDDEHDEIDKPGSRDAFSVELLQQMKRRHEERIFHVTGLAEDQRTTPLRMVGMLYGKSVEVDRDSAAMAVIRGAQRFPRFSLSYRDSIEIDLRQLPGEANADDAYYRTATAMIDEVLEHKVREGIAREELNHLSVFAFARLPLLVYLGWRLGDNVPTDIYQRHRHTEAWEWPDPGAMVNFSIESPAKRPHVSEAVLLLNVSGTIHPHEIPSELASLPVFHLAADGTRHPDVFAGPAAVTSFSTACRSCLPASSGTTSRSRCSTSLQPSRSRPRSSSGEYSTRPCTHRCPYTSGRAPGTRRR